MSGADTETHVWVAISDGHIEGVAETRDSAMDLLDERLARIGCHPDPKEPEWYEPQLPEYQDDSWWKRYYHDQHIVVGPQERAQEVRRMPLVVAVPGPERAADRDALADVAAHVEKVAAPLRESRFRTLRSLGAVLDEALVRLAAARPTPALAERDDLRERVQALADRWDADRASFGVDGGARVHAAALRDCAHDLRALLAQPSEGTEAPVERCSRCGHMPHDRLGFCPNFASDNDCSCPGSSEGTEGGAS